MLIARPIRENRTWLKYSTYERKMFLLLVAAVLVSVSILFILKKWRQDHLHSLHTEEEWFGEDVKEESEECEPFTVRVSEEILTDLRHRLETARIPQSLKDTNFEYGFHSDYLREVVNYWKTEYDWRRQEEQLINRYPQFKTRIEGLSVHFIHVKPAGERKQRRVFPLLVLHGWPGSFVEFYKLIPLLTTERDDQDFVFEVICPSIPGYGFSESPHRKGFGVRASGRVFKTLMERLGHSKFYVQGGDWGATIAINMSKAYPNKILGVHVNYFTFDAFSVSLAAKYILASVWPSLLSPQEYKSVYPFRERIGDLIEATGYFHIQSTRPDTLAYALNDSPVGLAAYILEKFALWTDSTNKYLPDGGLTKKFTLDELLTNIMIYWVNANISSTHRFYKETFSDDHWSDYAKRPIEVPCGITNCVNDLPAPKFFISRNLVKNLVMHSSHDKGGHFLALEEPQLLADDIWKFVRLVEEQKISQLIKKKLKKK